MFGINLAKKRRNTFYEVPRLHRDRRRLEDPTVEYPDGFDFAAEQFRSDCEPRIVPKIIDYGYGRRREIDWGNYTVFEPRPMEAWLYDNIGRVGSIFMLSVILMVFLLFIVPFGYREYVIAGEFLIWGGIVMLFIEGRIRELDDPYCHLNTKKERRKVNVFNK